MMKGIVILTQFLVFPLFMCVPESGINENIHVLFLQVNDS